MVIRRLVSTASLINVSGEMRRGNLEAAKFVRPGDIVFLFTQPRILGITLWKCDGSIGVLFSGDVKLEY